jgi:hypothetical protein
MTTNRDAALNTDIKPEALLDMLLCAHFQLAPDHSQWDGESWGPHRLTWAHGEGFELLDDSPSLHTLLKAYAIKHRIHVDTYTNDPMGVEAVATAYLSRTWATDLAAT